jgi:hypothetical protein
MSISRALPANMLPWVLCASLAGSVGTCTEARAQAIVEPEGYRGLVEDGIAEYDANHFHEARALFWQAYSLHANARVMRCLGMVEFELRNYRDSAAWLGHALSSQVHPLTPELRAETERLVARANGFIAKLQLTLTPAETAVLIDGAPDQLATQGTLLLEAGEHTLTFRAPGYVTQQRLLEARGGEVQGWSIRLDPEAQARLPDEAPVEPRHRRFFVAPRMTLVMPGKGVNRDTCSGALCTSSSDWGSNTYQRNAAPMLGIDGVYELLPAVRAGFGLHVQLNTTSWEFAPGDDLVFGRSFWLPAHAEYRVRLAQAWEVPLRAMVGMALVQPGRDFKRLGDSARSACESNAAQGIACSVSGPPGVGVILGAGPGVAYSLGHVALRADLMLGYQRTRDLVLEMRHESGSGTRTVRDSAFLAALALSVEL